MNFFFVPEKVIRFLKFLLYFVIGAAVGDTMMRFGFSRVDVLFHGLFFLCAVMIGFNLGNFVRTLRNKKRR